MNANIWIYIAVMAAVTYLIRMIPITLIRGKIRNRTVRSFLYYVPYVTLGAMTVPAVFHATNSVISAAVGLAVALVMAYKKVSMILVAVFACAAVFLTELIPNLPV